ncbi:hypothetical protein E2C01_065390 [Portunus trituberculatus]|uniref:Uncharacterized protein n=1 Tax=Portunus trituberculatus TaxID=210409 RepID=A0A5B7HEF9_PORTR|nr:hypothetical protein [Portunus trituberculatus]
MAISAVSQIGVQSTQVVQPGPRVSSASREVHQVPGRFTASCHVLGYPRDALGSGGVLANFRGSH